MTYHVLNGDALTDRFVATGLPGEAVITREALIEGDLEGDSLDEFYKTRARYFDDPELYYAQTVSEFNKLSAAADHSEFNLWFGYDLFCRANMWFILSLLNDLPLTKEIYAVYPSHLKREDIWKDFGGATPADLKFCFNNRVRFSKEDIDLAKDLWLAYKKNDLHKLKQLSKHQSACFPYLDEVIRAHIERFPAEGQKGRPEKVIEDILEHSAKDFNSVFVEFFKREGVYGFGDDQLRPIYDKVISHQ